jgi:hypothetical protein
MQPDTLKARVAVSAGTSECDGTCDGECQCSCPCCSALRGFKELTPITIILENQRVEIMIALRVTQAPPNNALKPHDRLPF